MESINSGRRSRSRGKAQLSGGRRVAAAGKCAARRLSSCAAAFDQQSAPSLIVCADRRTFAARSQAGADLEQLPAPAQIRD